EPRLAVVRAGAGGRERVAGAAEERRLEAQRRDADLGRFEAVEDLLRLVGSVEAPHPRVVAADDEVRDPVVLADEGVEERLARPRVAHRGGGGGGGGAGGGGGR